MDSVGVGMAIIAHGTTTTIGDLHIMADITPRTTRIDIILLLQEEDTMEIQDRLIALTIQEVITADQVM